MPGQRTPNNNAAAFPSMGDDVTTKRHRSGNREARHQKHRQKHKWFLYMVSQPLTHKYPAPQTHAMEVAKDADLYLAGCCVRHKAPVEIFSPTPRAASVKELLTQSDPVPSWATPHHYMGRDSGSPTRRFVSRAVYRSLRRHGPPKASPHVSPPTVKFTDKPQSRQEL